MTQFTVPIWPFLFHYLLKWLNLLLPLAIHFSPVAPVTQFTVPIWPFNFSPLAQVIEFTIPFGHSFSLFAQVTQFTVPIWPFSFHHLLKWLNLLFPFGHSFFTIYSSDSIYWSHLAIRFSPLAQMTQFTVPFGHSFFTTCSSDSIYCSHLVIHFSLFAQVTQFTVPIWPFLFHHLLKWLNLLFPFGHSFFTICSSDSIYCSHLAIPFSPLAQVTQFTVLIWTFFFTTLLNWQLTQYSVPFGHSFFTSSSIDSIFCSIWPFLFTNFTVF